MATILPKPGEAIDPVEPTRYLNERMAYYMVSRYRQLSGQRARSLNGVVCTINPSLPISR